jgi:hypothetical protein
MYDSPLRANNILTVDQEEEPRPSGPFCGQCKHWRVGPVDPNNIGRPGTRPGNCHRELHSTMIANRQGQLVTVCYYPNPPENFQACSFFQSKLELREVN